MKRRSSGYTFIEILVVILISSCIVFFITSCAVGGYLVYDYATKEDNTEQVDTQEQK